MHIYRFLPCIQLIYCACVGEKLEKGIQPAYILGEDGALVLQANEEHIDHSVSEKGIRRDPGEKWMIYGPTDFIPNIHAKVVGKR